MTTISQVFGTSTSFTMNSTSWTTGKTNSSDAVNVAGIATVPVDIQITVSFTMPSGTPGAQKGVNVYVAISEDGTNYTDNDQYSGTNNQQTTLRTPTNFLGPIFIAAGTASISVKSSFFLSQLTGGSMPRKFGIICENQTNLTPTSLAATYTPINWQNA